MTSIAQINENEQREIEGTLKRYSEAFGKNTVYRFLNSARTNWERLTCILSARIRPDRRMLHSNAQHPAGSARESGCCC